MIERRPILDAISHLVLIIGVIVVIFPLYVAFVASTQTAEQSAMSPISLMPGAERVNNYHTVLTQGASGNVSPPPVSRRHARLARNDDAGATHDRHEQGLHRTDRHARLK